MVFSASRIFLCGHTSGTLDGQTNSGTGRPSALVSTYSSQYHPIVTGLTAQDAAMRLEWRGALGTEFDLLTSSNLVEWVPDPANSGLTGVQYMSILLTNRNNSSEFLKIRTKPKE